MSTASFGVVGLSSARTMTPEARALRIAGTTPGPAGTIKMAMAPDATAVSMALDWTSSESPVLLDVMASSTPSLAASAFAASAIFLKYGFVSVATSKATLGPSAEALREQARTRTSAAADALLKRSHRVFERDLSRIPPP